MAKIDKLIDASITSNGKTQARHSWLKNYSTTLTVNWIAETNSYELIVTKGGFQNIKYFLDFNEVIEKYNNLKTNPHYEIRDFLNS